MARLSKRQIQRRAASQKARELSKTKARNNNQGASEQGTEFKGILLF